MTFYHLRRRREAIGWRQLGLSVVLLMAAAALPVYGLPVAYEYFPPSPTPSITPTITLVPSITVSPTITLSPTITDTPVVSDTPTSTPTPFIPAAIQAIFESSVTPNPDAATVFQNPVGHVYAIFSYDGMLPGVQWTTLWLRGGQLVHYETKPWDGATGGSGFTDWNPSPDQWQPGVYTVQLFVGEQYIVNGRFLVQGEPPTSVPSASPSPTLAPITTLTPTRAAPGTRTSSAPPATSPATLPVATATP
jgi:hypothetical protein